MTTLIPIESRWGLVLVGDPEFVALCQRQGTTSAEQALWAGIAADFVEDNRQRVMESTTQWANPEQRETVERTFTDLVNYWRWSFLRWQQDNP